LLCDTGRLARVRPKVGCGILTPATPDTLGTPCREPQGLGWSALPSNGVVIGETRSRQRRGDARSPS